LYLPFNHVKVGSKVGSGTYNPLAGALVGARKQARFNCVYGCLSISTTEIAPMAGRLFFARSGYDEWHHPRRGLVHERSEGPGALGGGGVTLVPSLPHQPPCCCPMVPRLEVVAAGEEA
jgi:hypothetical protein